MKSSPFYQKLIVANTVIMGLLGGAFISDNDSLLIVIWAVVYWSINGIAWLLYSREVDRKFRADNPQYFQD